MRLNWSNGSICTHEDEDLSICVNSLQFDQFFVLQSLITVSSYNNPLNDALHQIRCYDNIDPLNGKVVNLCRPYSSG